MNTSQTGTVVAVDLGATSGRVIVGHVGPNELRLEAVARFPNNPVTITDDKGESLRWNIEELRANVMAGLAEAGRVAENIVSIAIDTWAVDYALMRGGRMVGTPFHYRDERTAEGVETVHAVVPFEELYAQNGLQFLPFNTLYQLAWDLKAGSFERARTILMLPDLFTFWLTGVRVAEVTNASTSGLLVASRKTKRKPIPRVNTTLLDTLGLPVDLFSRLVTPGTEVGELLPDVVDELGYQTMVTAVGSHDTASAVVAVPMTDPNAAYISCGTWGLAGVEIDRPVLTEASRDANFTNEGGVDGRTRFLHNVMGLWILTESIREWERTGTQVELQTLLSEAATLPGPIPIFDVDDPRFLPPGDMPSRIAEWFREHNQPEPYSPAMFARSILESLAKAFAAAVRTASELSGKSVNVIHIVGGGSQNTLLCQLTADRSGMSVLAGPVEATAIGNVLVQARSVGLISGSLEDLRELVARTHPPTRYEPSSPQS